jgi:cell division protein FtsB
MSKSSFKIGRWIVAGVIAFMLFSIVAGKSGLISLWNLDKECNGLELLIKEEREKIDSLTLVEERLKTDSTYIKRTIREELGYIKDGETIIKFVDRD